MSLALLFIIYDVITVIEVLCNLHDYKVTNIEIVRVV